MKIVKIKPHKSVVKRTVCLNCGVTLEYVLKDVKVRTYSCCGSLESDPMIKCLNCGEWLIV